MSARAPARLALAALVVLAACESAPRDDRANARTIEGRLLAPCCWTQTLDTHESETVTALRAEIRERVRRGESAASIEDALAARYGERIRAVPRARDPRGQVVSLVALAMAAALVLVASRLRRWARAPAPATSPPGPGDDDRRIDEELARLDD